MNANHNMNNVQEDEEGVPSRILAGKRPRLSVISRRRKNTEILPDFFQHIDDSHVKKELIKFFNESILKNLERLNAVYLERFGFLIPQNQDQINYIEDDKLFEMRRGKSLKISFEKCSDPSNYFKEKYSPIDFLDILKSSFDSRSESLHQISLPLMLRYAKVFVDTIKRQVVIQGVSFLMDFGIFYSLHNRQGNDFMNWYAGADIFFVQDKEKLSSLSKGFQYKKPVYKNSLEVFETAFGSPIGVVSVNLKKELVVLGFNVEDVQNIKDPCFNLFVYEDRENVERGDVTLYYVTDFLRQYGINEYGVGNEFVFQLSVLEKNFNHNGEIDIPKYPTRAFAAAWLSLQNSTLREEKTQFVIKYDVPLLETPRKLLDGIFITSFKKLPKLQQALDGNFYYKNILGVTAEEVAFAKELPMKFICDLLAYKKLDQVTKLGRHSILDKTEYLTV